MNRIVFVLFWCDIRKCVTKWTYKVIYISVLRWASLLVQFTTCTIGPAKGCSSKKKIPFMNQSCIFTNSFCLCLLLSKLNFTQNTENKYKNTSYSWTLNRPTSLTEYKYQILFHKKNPSQDFINRTLPMLSKLSLFVTQ